MVRIIALCAVAAALTVPTLAHAQERKKNDPDEIVCKVQKRTQTRLPKRNCMTRAQWNEMAEQNRRDYAAMRDRPVIGPERDN